MNSIYRFTGIFLLLLTALSLERLLPLEDNDIDIFAQIGHSSGISSTAFSPNGKYFVTGSSDMTIKIWEADSGREIRTLFGHTGNVSSVTFSPDGKYIASSGNKTIKLWEVDTGKEIKTLTDHSGVGTVIFNPDGKYIASCSGDRTIKLWEVDTSREIKTLTGHTKGVTDIAFNKDGKIIVSGSNDNTIKLWNVSTGEEIKTIINAIGHTIGINSIVFSPNEKFIVAGCNDGTVKQWDIATGKINWIYSRERFKGTVPYFPGSVKSISYSRDGRYIAACYSDYVVNLINASNGHEIWSLSNNDLTIYSSILFSDDCRYITLGSSDQTVKLLETASGKEIGSFAGHSNYTFSVVYSHDGKYIASGGEDKNIKLWETDTGKLIKTFEHSAAIFSITFSPDGKYIASGSHYSSHGTNGYLNSGDSSLKMWDLVTGSEIWTFSGHTGGVYSVAFSPDGKYIASGSNDHTIKLWDITKGKEVKTLSGHSNSVYSISYSPDGKYIASGSDDKTIKLWNVATGKILRTFFGHSKEVNAVVFSPDGRQIVSGSFDNTIKVWNTANGKEIKTFSGHSGHIEFIAFNLDGKSILSGSTGRNERNLILWNLTTGKTIWNISRPSGWFNVGGSRQRFMEAFYFGPSGGFFSAAFSPDKKKIAVCFYDKTIKLLDVATGKEIAQFISFSGTDSQVATASRGLTVETQTASSTIEGEWLSITPDGYYQASPRGDRFLNVRVGNTVSGIDSYRSVFYNPDVVQARLQGRPDPASKANVTIQQAANFMPPQVTIKSPSTFTTTNTATTNLSVTITDQNQSIKNIKIFINGRAVGKNELAAIKGNNLQTERTSLTVTGNQKTVNFELPITLDPGRNLIEVVAFNGYSESARLSPIEVTYNAPVGQQRQLPNLWILAVGVNNYDNSSQVGGNLRFAVADAKRLTEALKSQEGRRYAKVNTLIIGDGETILPTADNIKRNLNFLDQAGDRDIVLLFLAGHGVSAQNGRFFFLPKDAIVTGNSGNWRVDESRAISGEEITAVLEGQGNRLLFIDACQSGGVDNNRMIRAMMESNAFVFAASQGNELSYEDTRWGGGHGVFTYNVLNALRGAPAALAEGNVSVRSMSGFVSLEVPKMTDNRQNPRVHSLLFADFPLAVIK